MRTPRGRERTGERGSGTEIEIQSYGRILASLVRMRVSHSQMQRSHAALFGRNEIRLEPLSNAIKKLVTKRGRT